MPSGREPPALWIFEVGTRPPALFEDAVLFPQVGHYLKLPDVYPSRNGDKQNPPADRVEHLPSRRATVARTISDKVFE